MRTTILSLCLLIGAALPNAAPQKDTDDPRQSLSEAHALRMQPGRHFDALVLALGAIPRFQAAGDSDGEAEADFLAGLLLEENDLAAWYRSQYPVSGMVIDPAVNFLTQADERFKAAGDWVGSVKTAYELGNLQQSRGAPAVACEYYRLALRRYAAGQASQPAAAITILTPEHRDFRETLDAAAKKSCTEP